MPGSLFQLENRMKSMTQVGRSRFSRQLTRSGPRRDGAAGPLADFNLDSDVAKILCQYIARRAGQRVGQ
jgi:hypothetical protein